LEEGKVYLIQVKLKNPQGRREEVFLDGKKATPVGDPDNHLFKIAARGFQIVDDGSVVLKIRFLE